MSHRESLSENVGVGELEGGVSNKRSSDEQNKVAKLGVLLGGCLPRILNSIEF